MSEAHGTHGNSTDPNEPKTPLWLTGLGAILFLAAGLVWALRTPTPDPSANPGVPAAAADAGTPGH